MATVTGKLAINQNFGQANSTGIPGSGFTSGATLTPAFNVQTSGTAADQVDLKYTKRLTFVASTAQPLDLTSLTDDVGGTVNFARVKSLTIVLNSTTDAASLTIGQGTTLTNAWTSWLSNPGTMKVAPSSAAGNAGGLVVIAPSTTAYTVGSTNKVLLLTPSAHAFTVDIEITGCSA